MLSTRMKSLPRSLGVLENLFHSFLDVCPYCDLDLVPKFDYDIEKAKMIACTHVIHFLWHPAHADRNSIPSGDNESRCHWVMLAMGLASKLVGTFTLTIPFGNIGCLQRIPVLSSSYPTKPHWWTQTGLILGCMRAHFVRGRAQISVVEYSVMPPLDHAMVQDLTVLNQVVDHKV